jgi:hypothetical protein
MSLEEYQEIQIDKFQGLYARGLKDECTIDHATITQNMKYNRRGETLTRDGTVLSLHTTAPIKRMFAVTFAHDANETIVLTNDGLGNIYRSDLGTVLLNIPNMVDFFAFNVFSWCLIIPILSVATGNNPVYIWQGQYGVSSDPVPIRPAAGKAPQGGSYAAAESANAGDCDIGLHKFAVSFITNTGYTTKPGPVITGVFTPATATSTGGFGIDLSNIPLGPAGTGTVARQILATQSDQSLYFFAAGRIWNGSAYVPWDGVIHDNTTTSISISFFDTDLAVSADSLFDLLEVIPANSLSGIAGATFYHGRVLYWGGEFNLVRVTFPGSAEAIDDVVGFVQLPDQFDGNNVTSSMTLQDALYFFKFPGIFSVTDNGGDPDTWVIIMIDGGAGSYTMSLGTINLSTPATPQNEVGLITDYGGVYLFTGAVQQPPLTWKINDLWQEVINFNGLTNPVIAIDPYSKVFYVAFIGTGSIPAYPNLFVGDYNDGLDSTNIKWSVYNFPFPISNIGMMSFKDATELAYRLRIASGTDLNKILPGALTDLGSAIVCVWRTFYSSPKMGALNIFRFLRARMPFYDPICIQLFSQDDAFSQNPPGFIPPYFAGRDLTREFNFMDEKMAIQICCNAKNGGFILQRLGIFCKPRFNMRPSV